MERMVQLGGALVVTAGAYSANDVVGGVQTARIDCPSGYAELKLVRIGDDADVKAASKLYLFNAEPTTIADNGAFAPTIADLRLLAGVVAIASADYASVNSNAHMVKNGLSVLLPVPNNRLWWYLTCDATPTYAATTDLTLLLNLLV